MILDALLAAGIAFSAASQLRVAGLPLGPGEVCLSLWIGLCALSLVLTRPSINTIPLFRFLSFWVAFALTMSIGTCVGYLTDDKFSVVSFFHDSFAYLLLAATTCLAVATADQEAPFRRTMWFVVAFAAAGNLVQLAAGWHLIRLPLIDPWYWDRFRGWSENPNQLGLYCVIFMLLALHLAATSTGLKRYIALVFALLTLVAGRLSKSDTFLLSTLAAGAVLILLRLRAWLTRPQLKSRLRYQVAVLVTLAALPLSLSLLPYGLASANDAKRFALSFDKDKGSSATEDTAELRLFLWGQAVQRGTRAAGLGLGPGPHLERPFVKQYLQLEKPFEAHSTILDTFLQGGVLAVALLVWLLLSAAAGTYLARLDVLVAMICAICVFSIFHFILRHPIVWFAVAVCIMYRPTRAQRTHSLAWR